MDKDNWIKQQVRNRGSFKSFLVMYGIIIGVFIVTGLM